jgi:Regulator of ribonuclease activity B
LGRKGFGLQRSKTMITLQQLNEMFAQIRANTTWDVGGEMLWGYFFTDPDPKKLELAAQHLIQKGFRFVSIHETDEKDTHFLHVERVERHSPQTLHNRNTEFYRLAEEFDLASYDGMDVGPVQNNSD